jgi:hypothetical protein
MRFLKKLNKEIEDKMLKNSELYYLQKTLDVLFTMYHSPGLIIRDLTRMFELNRYVFNFPVCSFYYNDLYAVNCMCIDCPIRKGCIKYPVSTLNKIKLDLGYEKGYKIYKKEVKVKIKLLKKRRNELLKAIAENERKNTSFYSRIYGLFHKKLEFTSIALYGGK